VREIDLHFFRVLHETMSGGVVLCLAAALTVIGEGWTVLAFLPMLAFARTRRFGAGLVGTCVVTGIVVFAVKETVRRARPCACLPDVHARVFAAPTDYSFPSGHAAGAFACAAFVGLVIATRRREWGGWRWAAVAPAFALAAGIALSRVVLGVHFPADIAAGAVLGASLGLLGARVTHRSGSERSGPEQSPEEPARPSRKPIRSRPEA
jgi:undecaprenyl-diphosphatase